MRLDDRLGYLVPPGRIRRPQLEQGLCAAMEQCQSSLTHGLPSVATRYVIAMHPADLAWLDPYLSDVLERAMRRRAESLGAPTAAVSVSFESDVRLEQGRPQYWAGFADDDLLVLANADPQPMSARSKKAAAAAANAAV